MTPTSLLAHGLVLEEAAEQLHRVLAQRRKREEALQHLEVRGRRVGRPLHVHLWVDVREEGRGLPGGHGRRHGEAVLPGGAVWHGRTALVTHGSRGGSRRHGRGGEPWGRLL